MVRNNLSKVAEALGYNCAQVAEGTGMSYNAVYRIWNNGVTKIEFDSLDKLCTFLDVSPAEILEHVPDDEMTPEDYEHMREREQEMKKYRSYRK